MFRLFMLSLQIIIFILLSFWIVNNSFLISFEIGDLIYSLSSVTILIFLFVFLLIIFIVQTTYFRTKFQFLKFKLKNNINKKERGFNAFVNSMIALANKDFKTAIKNSYSVDKYLGSKSSINLLLQSEIYKVEKKNKNLNLVYEEMCKNEKTQNLGYRGLMEQYLRSEDYHHAFIYGEKLFNNNPYIEKIYDTLVSIISKTNNWQQLVVLTDAAYQKKIINKEFFSLNKSIAYYEIAKIKQLSEENEAIKLIEKALELRKNFPPYVTLYIDLLIQNKKYSFAKKFIKKVWSSAPYSNYKESIRRLSLNLNMTYKELVKFITDSNPNNYESKILLAEALIEDKDWSEAKNQLKNYLDHQPKKEICQLMSKIEEGDSGDPQKVNAWLLRGRNGALSNLWICKITKNAQKDWSSLSNSGYFNSLEWRQPSMINQIELSDNN